MYHFFETIKIIDGFPVNLEYHQKRMNYTFNSKFGANIPPVLKDIINVPEQYKSGLVKCKVEYNSHQYHAIFSNYVPKTVDSLKIVYDDSIIYDFKYVDRSELQRLLIKKGDCDEILIVKQRRITDTSYSNIAFFDGDRWYTPDSPLLPGTARTRLLETGLISATHINMQNIRDFKSFILINSMLDIDFSNMKPVSSIHE